MTDLSGNGVHLQRATNDTKRPVVNIGSDGRGGVTFDSIDDALASVANLDLGTGQVTVLAAFRKVADVSAFVCELSDSAYSRPGSFALIAGAGGGAQVQMYSRGATGAAGGTVIANAPITCVAVGVADTSAYSSTRVNKGSTAVQTAAQGGGNYGSYPLYVGARNGGSGGFGGGTISEIIIRAGILSEADITGLTEYLYAKAGA